MRVMKLAGWAGVLGFALAAIGSAVVGLFVDASIFDFPGSQAPGAEVASFVAAHRSSALAAMILNTLGVSLWLVFGTGVWLRLREGGESVLSASFALGLAGAVTLILAGFVPFFLLAYRHGDPAHARLLYDLTFGLLAMSGVPTAIALWSYFLLVRRTGLLPRWTAVLAAVAAAAHDLLLVSFVVSDGFFSLQGQVISVIPATLFAWIFGTSIALLRAPAALTSPTRPG
jgi:hypothetical protein